jgi:hypothetical protein
LQRVLYDSGMPHWGWVSALLITGTVAACGDSSSSGVSELSVMADDNHLVAVAYRQFSQAQKVCVDKVKSGEIQKDADAKECLDAGFSASGLEQRIEALRLHVVAIGQAGSDACKKEADIYAGRVLTEKSALLALHHDLVNDDINAYNSDLHRAGATAGRENVKALFSACR